MKIRHLLLAAMLFALCGCKMDGDPILFRSALMGYLQEDGSFNGDDGRTYIFNNVSPNDNLKGISRLMVLLDAKEKLEDGITYYADLLEYEIPLYKEPFTGMTPELVDSLGTDPLHIDNIWFSGKCLNMMNTFISLDGNSKHSVDLLVKEFPMQSDTLKLMLMHNAGTDKVADTDDWSSGDSFSFYTSFPLENVMPEKGGFVLDLEWRWSGEVKNITHVIK